MKKYIIFFTSLLISTVVFFGLLTYTYNPIFEFDLSLESQKYDLVIVKQNSGYFELTLNSKNKNIEIVINKDEFLR